MKSPQVEEAIKLVHALQLRFVEGLQRFNLGFEFDKSSWLRDGGRHGGGQRFFAADTAMLNRASVNVSHVHYDDDPDKKLGSATALSTIIHPQSPRLPSLHMHISWTEMKSIDANTEVNGYWRVMADLNPSIENPEATKAFKDSLQKVAPEQYSHACEQGDRYFYIPALKRHRGVAHFYLESYRSDSTSNDRMLAQSVGWSVIDCYLHILERGQETQVKNTKADSSAGSERDKQRQLAYHTLYFFQVLTLDRGTVSGLLVHNQNDLGIMGSLPSHVDRSLILSWRHLIPDIQQPLLDGLIGVLSERETSPVDSKEKVLLAEVVRNHYRTFPEALQCQASGDIIPGTVGHHGL